MRRLDYYIYRWYRLSGRTLIFIRSYAFMLFTRLVRRKNRKISPTAVVASQDSCRWSRKSALKVVGRRRWHIRLWSSKRIFSKNSIPRPRINCFEIVTRARESGVLIFLPVFKRLNVYVCRHGFNDDGFRRRYIGHNLLTVFNRCAAEYS